MGRHFGRVPRRTVLAALGAGLGLSRGGGSRTAVAAIARGRRSAAPDETVVIRHDLVHLGDGNYSGSANSRFQASGRRTRFETSFKLTAAQADADAAGLAFMARGVEKPNEVFVNGVEVGTTPTSPADGTANREQISVAQVPSQIAGTRAAYHRGMEDSCRFDYSPGRIRTAVLG
ncbi:hypothetical protein HALDL1_06795 [Halobacterium sp. DL1]|nr:hypothetical protein HALDL1_06795 [Halobacterium sp. DL1]